MHEGPDFFVVGAPKAATTTLYEHLGRHPDLFVPTIKEPHYFSWPHVADTYYRASFVSTEAAYGALYAQCPEGALAGDFSTSYLFSEIAAGRIRDRLPNAKIIIVLRDPVERALSHHRMDVRDGYTSEPIETLIAPSASDPRFRREYIDVGRYAQQIQRYTERFPSEQIKIVLFDDLVGDTQLGVRGILEFLGVDVNHEIDESTARNVSGVPRSSVSARIVRSSVTARFAATLPPRLRALARRTLLRSEDLSTPTLASKTLALEFAGELDMLEELLGIDLAPWRR